MTRTPLCSCSESTERPDPSGTEPTRSYSSNALCKRGIRPSLIRSVSTNSLRQSGDVPLGELLEKLVAAVGDRSSEVPAIPGLEIQDRSSMVCFQTLQPRHDLSLSNQRATTASPGITTGPVYRPIRSLLIRRISPTTLRIAWKKRTTCRRADSSPRPQRRAEAALIPLSPTSFGDHTEERPGPCGELSHDPHDRERPTTKLKVDYTRRLAELMAARGLHDTTDRTPLSAEGDIALS